MWIANFYNVIKNESIELFCKSTFKSSMNIILYSQYIKLLFNYLKSIFLKAITVNNLQTTIKNTLIITTNANDLKL